MGWGCFPTSSRTDLSPNSPDVEKASPSGRGALPTRTLGPLRRPESRCHAPLTPFQPRDPALPPDPPASHSGARSTLAPSRGPKSVCPSRSSSSRSSSSLTPLPAAEATPTHHTPSPPPRLAPPPSPDSTPAPPPYLTASAARPQPSSSRREPAGMPAVTLSLFTPAPPRLAPASPRAQGWLKRNEPRQAITENRELKSPQ